ncbi:MAG TPA: hypothetical protein VGK84_01480 [Candidatus Tumulicola sp.]
MKRRFLSIATLLALALAVQPAMAPAASSGLAWDSVIKLVAGADPASLQPGSFDSDFATASAVQTEDQGGGGGIFGHLKQAMAMGKNAMQMFSNGLAEHHYVAGYKERTDQIAMQTATITDCSARTITTLDLRHKTYTVVSMDQPQSSGGGSHSSDAPHPMASDDLSHLSISIKNTALGPRTVAGVPTQGYRSNTTMTATNAQGQTSTSKGQMIGYYAAYAMPSLSCRRFGSGSSMGPTPAQTAQGMQEYGRLTQALAASHIDKRFSISQSGPSIPLGHFSLYDAVTFQGQSGGGGASFETERGNVHSVSASDPIFSVPSDFTLQK